MMKVVTWLNHEIRFVEINDEWLGVAKDVAKALDLKDATEVANMADEDEKLILTNNDLKKSRYPLLSGASKVEEVVGRDYYRQSKVTLLNELGIYEAIFNSRKKEAKEFKRWIKQTIKELRKQSGLEPWQVFRMMDKDHQKSIMENLHVGLPKPEKKHYIKANTIANKAISTKYGYSKMIKKGDMTDEMLAERQPILNDTAELMVAKEHFNLDIKVSDVIYDKHTH